MEKIISIEESSFKINDTDSDYWGRYEGYTARVSNPGNQMNTETSDKLLGYLIKISIGRLLKWSI